MDFTNIKANFLGDSITRGIAASTSSKAYHQVLARKLGFAEARNYGISGTRLARQYSPSLDNPAFDMDFCSRFSEMDDDANLIVVFGGTNDFGHGDAPIGEMADRTPDTFFGACHYLMTGLMKKYPEAKIVIMTPLHRASENNPSKNGKTLEFYVNIIKEVAKYYSLPVCDLWSLLADISPTDTEMKEKYFPDGLHPNDLGHEQIALALEGFLKGAI